MKKINAYAVKFAKNVASGGAARALSLCFVYSFDYAHTRLANTPKLPEKVVPLVNLMVELMLS